MKIWAHRGCSQCYPENTITSFEKAMFIPGLEGIELDIQLTSDRELVVIHDERVDRTTDGVGFVRDYTLTELKKLNIDAGDGRIEHIPTMREVFDLLNPKLKSYSDNPGEAGIRLNIELKNSIYPYHGMEEKIADMISEYGVGNAIVFSSFYARSLEKMHAIMPSVEIGMLDGKVSDCLYKATAIENIYGHQFRMALHPGSRGMDLEKDKLDSRTVRMFFGGHLYPEKPTPGKMDLDKLAAAGVTDVFLNEPEKYL